MGREYTGCTVGIEAFASPVYEEVSWAVSNRHGFTDLSPGDYSRFQYHLRFHSKVLRLPKDKVRECTDLHRTNDVRDSMSKGATNILITIYNNTK